MKHYFTKQNFVNFGGNVLPAIIVFSLAFGIALAQTAPEQIRGSIDEKQQLLEQITNEIQNLQREITKRQNNIASLANEVALFDLQIRQTEAQIEAVELQIEKLTAEIYQIELEISRKEAEMAKQKEYLAEILRLINEYDSYGPLELTLSSGTFSELLDQAQYASSLQEKSQEVLAQVRLLKAQLEEKKDDLSEKADEQRQNKLILGETKKSLQAQRGAKDALLSATRGQERLYQALLGQAAQKQEEISREVYDLEVQLRRQLGDKTLPPISGALRWPASGILTQGYGNTGFTALGYSFHNGIDIAGPPGTRIYAAGDGLVHATGRGEAAYGNWIVIKHTISKDGKIYNIYTLYAHLQGFNTSTGKTVRAGDVIGYMGNTGNTTRLLYGPERGYHLHFSVFDEDGFGIQGGAYQHIYGSYQIPYGYTYNPMNFLK